MATTLLMPLLSYQYDNFLLGTCGISSLTQVVRDSSILRKFLQEGAPVKFEFHRQMEVARVTDVQVKVPTRFSLRVEPKLLQAVVEPNTPERAFLTIDQVTLPKEDDFYTRVFINHPDASASTPISDPHYAGSFAFFSDVNAKHMDGMHPNYLVDLTETLRNLKRADALAAMDKIDVQLVLVPLAEKESISARQFRFERVRLGFMH